MRMRRRPNKHKKRPLLRRVVLVFGTILAAFIVLVVLVASMNLYDPELDRNALAAINWSPPVVPDAENSYFTHVCLDVLPPNDPHQAGIEMVAQNNARMQQRAQEPRDYTAAARDVQAYLESLKTRKYMPWHGGDPRMLCPAPRTECLSAYAKNRSRIHDLVAGNPVPITRYRSLYRYRYFRETMVERVQLGVSPTPYFGSSAREVVLAEIGLKAIEGRGDEALRNLGQDIAYWRRVLAGAHMVLAKMISTIYIDRDYALLAEITARYRDQGRVIALAQTLTTPLTAEERSWNGPIIDQVQQTADMLLHMPGDKLDIGAMEPDLRALDWLPLRMVYKPHATVNLMYRQWQAMLALTLVSADQFRAAVERMKDVLSETTAIPRADMVYNPAGKYLVAVLASPGSFLRYVSDIHNLDGRMRLVQLQLEIYRQHYNTEGVDRYLKDRSPELHDPFTNKPMQWDGARHELWFYGVNGKHEGNDIELDQRIAIRI